MKYLILLSVLFFSLSAYSVDRCKAMTKKGTQCTRNAVLNDSLCTQHLHASKLVSDSILIGKLGGKYYVKNGIKHYVK